MKIVVLGPPPKRPTQRPGLGLSVDGHHWLMLDAAGAVPDALEPPSRDEPIAVVLTDARADHASGLLSLRDGHPIDLYATPAVFEQLTVGLPVLPVLQHYCDVHWRLVAVAGDAQLARFRIDAWPSLDFTAVGLDAGQGSGAGEAIALVVRDAASGHQLFYAPALDKASTPPAPWMDDSDCVIVGGDCRVWREGPAGTLPPPWIAALFEARAARKVLLQPLAASGCTGVPGARTIEIAYAGMEIEL
ncbi:MBL fold metallo-hydrolase [Calidifontimicrobium sp. SYSU G02091]|uniref:MBL fold metallo-hydrolase n=1 Tax=Calidifontimicrobium sp. SYSU G02091 TaxID=2926421 RepID=UPI001F53CE69|nr:MBL fold metallo-hydrolase [Calidifontimicrobium sp. SYSU G02091]